MSWRPIDFHGIVALDRRIVDQLDFYLQEKETRLANQILNIVQPLPGESVAPVLPPGIGLKLSDAVEGFVKKIRQASKAGVDQVPPDIGTRIPEEVSAALWEFAEVLDGCVVELFQQIKHVNIDRWHHSLFQVVSSIKDILIHRLEELVWTIHRLENPIKDYQLKFAANGKNIHWRKWMRRWKPTIDPALLQQLMQSEKSLKSQYESFHRRYQEYVRLSSKVENDLQKMKTYPILALLDLPDQNLYVDIFRLLNLKDLNPSGPLAEDITRSLRHLSSIDRVTRIFKIYYQGLEEAFFASSLELKGMNKVGENTAEAVAYLRQKVMDYDRELQHLLMTMVKYREFVAKPDAGFYTRISQNLTRLVGKPQPIKSRKLSALLYATEELSQWYGKFIESLSDNPLIQERKESLAHQEIEKILHEMGQPLISHAMMRKRAERLLYQIKNCDEVGSAHAETVAYVDNVLSRAMREDWKYHVLHEFSLFHVLYHLHRGLTKRIEDPAHAFRMEKFHLLFDQIEEWARTGDIYSHVHEVELDINDMKTYLQDFLAAVQRAAKEKFSNPFLDETIEKFRKQLLEYRYSFGQFFFELMSKDLESQQLRRQFLFVDQYFESIESLLQDLKISWEGKKDRKI